MKTTLKLLACCAAALVALAAPAEASSATNDADLVKTLPGLTAEVPFKHYAGHLELEAKEKMFYWYAESQGNPATDPIVLWLNGGPGCSSLGGFFTENGPFVVRNDLTVKPNRYSWNRKVNMVWLESPAGVGFSGDMQAPDYYNDDVVAAKTHEFVRRFFDKFAELKGRDFFVTGESYAGMYVPYLVDRLVDEPLEGVNLQGFAIGNPFTDNVIDGNAYMDYYYSHAMVSLESYERMKELCRDHIGCIYSQTPCPADCRLALEEADSAAAADLLDPYFIYGDICLMQNNQGEALQRKAKRTMPASPTHRGDVGACAETLTQLYLNLPEVQTAIHAVGPSDPPVNWTDCNEPVGEAFTPSPSSLPKYQNILGRGLNALIYSGDADSVVNFIGTERWIGSHGLKLHVADKWKAWFGPDKQLAGYVQEYVGLTYKTVKGAGHMVPAVRPLHGLHMFECFVFGETSCSTFTYPLDDDEIEAGLTVVQKTKSLEMITENALAKTGTGGHTIAWVPVLGLVCAVVAFVAVSVKNSRRRAQYQPVYSANYQSLHNSA